jgi:hypothetical protein
LLPHDLDPVLLLQLSQFGSNLPLIFFGFILLLSYSKLITAMSAAGGSLFEVACRYSDASMRNVVLERKVCSVVVSLFRTCVQEWDPPVKTPALELESSVQ